MKKVSKVGSRVELLKAIGKRTIRDATQPLDVVVTVSDWLEGSPSDRAGCAVALAIRASGGQFEGALVSRTYTYVLTSQEAIRYRNGSRMLKDVMGHFDHGHRLTRPKIYRLFAPTGVHRLGKRQGGPTDHRGGHRRAPAPGRRPVLTVHGVHRAIYSQR